jgi:hypothetical protein
MTDYWKHLNELSDGRGRLYAAVIGNDALGAHVLDLNCGKAPVFEYLEGYAFYYGNDVQPDFIEELQAKRLGRKALFELKDDKDVRVDRVDVLMFIGACGAVIHWGPNPESCTDIKTFMRIIGEHHPRVVLFEAAQEICEKARTTEIEDGIRKAGYDLDMKMDVTFGSGSYRRRFLWKWRKQV